MEQNDKAIDVLKTAILLERRGKAFLHTGSTPK